MNKLNKKIYNAARNYFRKLLTGNLGEVVEEDDKITCYVKKNRIKKKNHNYIIACFGIGKDIKEVAEKYKLNKPICYVIDGLELKKHKVDILGYSGCEVIIKNCNFNLDLIHVDGKCTLDNTDISVLSFLSIGADDLIIKNMKNDKIKVLGYGINILFGSKGKINVIDSNIGSQNENIKLSFSAIKNLNIVNSNIYSKDISCTSNFINIDEKSSLTAKEKVILKTDDFTPININAPKIILNEKEIKNEKQSVVLKKATDPLMVKRLELVNILKQVKEECESINSKKILKYQKKISAQPISKVLKKS